VKLYNVTFLATAVAGNVSLAIVSLKWLPVENELGTVVNYLPRRVVTGIIILLSKRNVLVQTYTVPTINWTNIIISYQYTCSRFATTNCVPKEQPKETSHNKCWFIHVTPTTPEPYIGLYDTHRFEKAE
jgi:hypothetical protein